MDLALLERTLADRGEPAYRAGQVWEWTAHGVAGYEAMTNVPGPLRATLAEEVPFSTLELDDGGILPLLLVADDGVRDRLAHRGRGLGQRVGAEVDHGAQR